MRWWPAARTNWLALVAAAGLALAVLAVSLRSGPVLALDGGMHAWVVGHRNAVLTWLAVVVTSLGSSLAVGTAVFVVAAVFVVVVLGTSRRRHDRHRRRQAVVVMAVLAAGSLLRFGLSVLVGRLRPPQRDWAYPASGNASPSDVLAGWLFALCWLSLAASLLPTSWRPWLVTGSRPFTASIETDTETGAHP